jgi:hypothetical protein
MLQDFQQKWDIWLDRIIADGKFISRGRLGFEGRVLKPGNIVVDGPYAEVKEIIGGILMIKAESMDAAFELTYDCPILTLGGHIEVRPLTEVA